MAKDVQVNGEYVRISDGARAFVPTPLPPVVEWKPRLARALSDADRLVGRLAGEGSRLPNPHLLMRPFLRREAVLSSRIEGTQATLGELLAAEAGADVERSPADLREVGNYVVALEYGLKRLPKMPLSLRLVRELHKRLMKGVRGGQAQPGEFRRVQNWIGTPGATIANARYVPPPPGHLPACLESWERFLHDRTHPPLVNAAMAHYQFEAIHPFTDGNGRVGRLMIMMQLAERDVLPAPMLYLSAFFEATRREYYDRLLAVSMRSEWDEWIEYFLNGVARQAEDALDRAVRINALLEKWRLAVAAEKSRTLPKVLERLAANPYLTITDAAEKLGVAYTTAQRAVEQLEKLGVVGIVSGDKRDRVYCATPIMEILDAPARTVAG